MSFTIDTTTLTDGTGNVVILRMEGKLTRDDYASFLPEINALIKSSGKIRLLAVMEDFHGWTPGALWEDARFGIHHFNDIERVAVVGDHKWEQVMTAFAKPFTAAKVRYFDASESDAAQLWITDTTDARFAEK